MGIENFPPSEYFKRNFATGLTRGIYRGCKFVHKFGHNGDVGTDLETLWGEGGIYAYPAAATVMKVSSSDADDTSAGAGARTVNIQGLDANYAEINENVTLTGQSQATTTNSFLRIHRMQVLTAGASGWNEGTIYIGTGSPTSGKPATVYGLIEPFQNQTLMSMYTVPAGFTAYSLQTHFSSSVAKQVSAGLYARTLGSVFQVREYYVLIDGEVVLNHQTGETYPEKTDLEGRAKVTVTGGDIACQIELLLFENSSK